MVGGHEKLVQLSHGEVLMIHMVFIPDLQSTSSPFETRDVERSPNVRYRSCFGETLMFQAYERERYVVWVKDDAVHTVSKQD